MGLGVLLGGDGIKNTLSFYELWPFIYNTIDTRQEAVGGCLHYGCKTSNTVPLISSIADSPSLHCLFYPSVVAAGVSSPQGRILFLLDNQLDREW